jgi:hypothetical protein
VPSPDSPRPVPQLVSLGESFGIGSYKFAHSTLHLVLLLTYMATSATRSSLVQTKRLASPLPFRVRRLTHLPPVTRCHRKPLSPSCPIAVIPPKFFVNAENITVRWVNPNSNPISTFVIHAPTQSKLSPISRISLSSSSSQTSSPSPVTLEPTEPRPGQTAFE